MDQNTAWWEELFEGNLSHGIDKDKLEKLENESFLYFGFEESEEEEAHLPL